MRPRWARERGLRAVTATSASSVRVCGGHALVFFFLKRVFWMLTLTPPSLDGLSNGYITSFNLPVTWPALSPTGTRESYFSGILEISLCSSLLSQSPISDWDNVSAIQTVYRELSCISKVCEDAFWTVLQPVSPPHQTPGHYWPKAVLCNTI